MQLAQAALEKVQELSQGSKTNIYAPIIYDSDAHKIALDLGFIPFIKITPGYSGGSSMIVMVKKIN